MGIHSRRTMLRSGLLFLACTAIFLGTPAVGITMAAVLPSHVLSPDRSDVDTQFLEKVLQLENALEQAKYDEARLLLLHLQQLFPQLSFAERTSVEGIQAISATFVYLKQLLSAVQLQPDEIRYVARQFSLAIDALIFSDVREQSRWQQRLQALSARLDTVRNEGYDPNPSTAAMLLEEYNLLRPALAVRQPAAVVRELDSLHQRMRQLQLQRHPSAEEWSALLEQLSHTYRQILHGHDRPTFAESLNTPLSRLMLGLAAFLILSLCYTAWCYRTFRSSWRT